MINDQASAPRIDVLIPVYNVEDTVIEAVQSILTQTFVNLRVVVIDDGSTDGTAGKLAAIAATDSRLVVHWQPNGGIVDALNNGLKFCSSEFLARHDGDDIAFPDRLERQVAYMDSNPDCIAVSANAFHIDESGRRNGMVTHMINPAFADASSIPAQEPYLMHPLLLLRREELAKIGGYRYVFHAEDADLYWRLRGCGRLHNMTEVLAEYRVHQNSITGKSALNGRVQAINSQLAAVSEMRRVSGRKDLQFPRELLERYYLAKTMPSMMAIAEEDLEPGELPHFRVAAAGKLLELASNRSYPLDDEDRDFIKSALVTYRNILTPNNRKVLTDKQARYIAALLKQKNWRATFKMAELSLVVPVIERFGGYLERLVKKQWRN